MEVQIFCLIFFVLLFTNDHKRYLCIVRYGEGRDLLAVAEPMSLRTVVEILHHHHTPTGVHEQTCRNMDTPSHTSITVTSFREGLIFSVLLENTAQYCMILLTKYFKWHLEAMRKFKMKL